MAGTHWLYLDETGTRRLDRKGREGTPGYNDGTFGYCGILLDEPGKSLVRAKYQAVQQQWPQLTAPLHSNEIRQKNKNFTWLRSLSDLELKRFYADLEALVTCPPIVVVGCVVSRRGYADRFGHHDRVWDMCRSAFAIVVERSVKWVRTRGSTLRVRVESAKGEDKRVRRYFRELKARGAPFDQSNSAKYSPLAGSCLDSTLGDLDIKGKQSPFLQIADLIAWPIAKAATGETVRTFESLVNAGSLIDSHLRAEDREQMGIKYYCFKRQDPAQNG